MLRLFPERAPWALDRLATLAVWLQDLPAALAHFDRLLELKPEELSYWEESGHCSSTLGDAEAALRRYARAVELGSVDWQIHLELAELLAEVGRFEEAAEVVSRVAWLDASERDAALKEEVGRRAREYKQRGGLAGGRAAGGR